MYVLLFLTMFAVVDTTVVDTTVTTSNSFRPKWGTVKVTKIRPRLVRVEKIRPRLFLCR